MWGYVYNRTVHSLSEIGDTFSLRGLAEPRTIGKELLPIPIGTWERNCLTPPGCGRFNGATEYALSRGIQSQIDRCIYIGSSSGELSSTEIRPEYLKPRLAKPLEIFVADDQMFEQRFDSCVAGILEDGLEGRFNPRNRCKD